MIDKIGTDKPLGLQDGTLRLAPYRTEWPSLYEQEADRIRQACPENLIVAMHHIGSTSIEGLAAKPILDIAIVAALENEEHVAELLVKLGYVDRGERSGRHFILQDGGHVRTHNLHLYGPGDERLRKQIAFRDALRRDPEAREQYEQLKTSLIGGARGDYAPGKTAFINRVSEN